MVNSVHGSTADIRWDCMHVFMLYMCQGELDSWPIVYGKACTLTLLHYMIFFSWEMSTLMFLRWMLPAAVAWRAGSQEDAVSTRCRNEKVDCFKKERTKVRSSTAYSVHFLASPRIFTHTCNRVSIPIFEMFFVVIEVVSWSVEYYVCLVFFYTKDIVWNQAGRDMFQKHEY